VAPTSVLWSPEEAVAALDIKVLGAESTPTWQAAGDLPFGSCALHQVLCPDEGPADCASLAAIRLPMNCPVDRAADYLPDGGWVQSLGELWPYHQGSWGAGPTADYPGALGSGCALRASHDADGDGYPGALDCDDADPDWIPIVPDDPEDPWCIDLT